jgi:hypothetical protein
MTSAKIADIHSIDELSHAIGASPVEMSNYLRSHRQIEYYDLILIPKRGRRRRGEFREVYKAKHLWIAQAHRSIAMIIKNSINYGEHVQGFLDGRSTLSNAALHMRQRTIVHADLKNFFNAITETQVESSFVAIGALPAVAAILARLCTIDGYLRQGTRCSPGISNLVCQKLDIEMLSIARVTSTVYSRYADNITLSGDLPPAYDVIKNIVENNSFELRDSGCYTQHRGARQFVTGLSVVDEEKPRLPKQMKRKLRLIVHYVSKYGEGHFEYSQDEPSITPTMTQLEGMIAYAYSVEPEFAIKLWTKLRG